MQKILSFVRKTRSQDIRRLFAHFVAPILWPNLAVMFYFAEKLCEGKTPNKAAACAH